MFYTGPKKASVVSGVNLTPEETQLVEDVLQMEEGYVLDLSDRTIRDFFAEFKVDIDAQKYKDGPTAGKANRVRSFLRQTPAPLVGRVMIALLDRRVASANHGLSDAQVARYRQMAARFGGPKSTPAPETNLFQVAGAAYELGAALGRATTAAAATRAPAPHAAVATPAPPPIVAAPTLAPAPILAAPTAAPLPIVARPADAGPPAALPPAPDPRSALPVPAKPICFVAQPFHEPFQGRFDEDIRPAIEAAGLTAYKVDEDKGADKLVEDIHAGIERASVVLVDITEDNPNVWYELGYSQALGKPLVMISCSSERPAGKPYPFDVRGRKIIDFATGRRSAHDKLQKDVTERIKALLEREEQKPPPPPAHAESRALVAAPTTDGVDEDTLLVIGIVLGGCTLEEDLMPIYEVKEALESHGLSKPEVAIAIRNARAQDYIQTREGQNHNGDSYDGVCLSNKGDKFVLQHPQRFKTDRTPCPPSGGYGGGRGGYGGGGYGGGGRG